MAVPIPIWQDTKLKIGSAYSPYEYSIQLDGEEIFSGKAYVAPDEDYIQINISKICQNYLWQEAQDMDNVPLNDVTDWNNATKAVRTFYVLDSGGDTAATYNFIYDWSYEKGKNYSADVQMSEPINGHSCSEAIKFLTYYESTYDVVRTKMTRGDNLITDIDDDEGYLYDNSYCGKYALYYVNRNGGWDSFLIEGKVRRSDSYNRYFTSSNFDNTTYEFEKKIYNNQITVSYELHTGWLKDGESKRLAKHLLSSNMVYLHDLIGGDIMPVIITNSSTEYKTFKNEGKLISYTINVDCSQTEQNL